MYGTITSKPSILILERAPFPTSSVTLSEIPSTLRQLKNLGANDIYFWYLASSGSPNPREPVLENSDLKINLIYPCTPQHVKKYSQQGFRVVTETPEIYTSYVRPYMLKKREKGRLNWVWNILEGRTEVEDVIYREANGPSDEGFLVLPDLNWDRKTMLS